MSAPFAFAVQPFQEQEEVEQNHETATDFENSLLAPASSSRSPRIKYTVQQLLALSKSPLSRKKPAFSNPIPEEILFEENARRTLLSSSPSLRGRGRGAPRGAKRYITSESRFPPRREVVEDESKRGKGGRTAAWFMEPIPEDVPILDESANLSEAEQKRRREFEEWRKKFNNTTEQPQQQQDQIAKPEQTYQPPQQYPSSNFFDGFGDIDETSGSGIDDLFTKISLKKKAKSGGSKFFPTEMKEDFEADRTISELIDVDDHLPSYAQAETEESILSSYGALPPPEYNGNGHNSGSILDLLKGQGSSSFEQPAPAPNGDFTDASSLEAEFLQGYANNEGITESHREKQPGFNAQSFFKQYENQYGAADPLMSVLQQQQPQIQNPLAELMPSYYPPQPMSAYNGYQYQSEPYVYQGMGLSSGNNMYNMQPEMYSEQSLLAQLNAQPPQEVQPQPVKKAPKQKKTSLVPTQMLMYQGKTYNDLKGTKTSPAATKKQEAPTQKQSLPTQNPFLNEKAMGAIPSLGK